MCGTRLAANTGHKNDAKKSPSEHHRNLPGYIFATNCIDSQKKNLLNGLHSCPRNGEVGPLTAEIGSGVWGTPTNFNGFRTLAALLHDSLAVGVSQTLRR